MTTHDTTATLDITISGLKTTALVDDSAPFSCTVLVNGVRAFIASDDGHGGTYRFDPLNARGKELLGKAEAYATSLPPVDVEGESMPSDLEILIGRLVDREEERAQLRRWARAAVVYRTPQMHDGEYATISGAYTVAIKAQILAEHPDAEILNETVLGQEPMDDDVARVKTFDKHVKKLCAFSTLFSLPGDKPCTYRKMPRPYTAQVRQSIVQQHPGIVIYNETIAGQRVA